MTSYGGHLNGVDGASHHFDVDLCATCCRTPGYWCFSCFCPWCSSYAQRKELLGGNLDNYRCCAGAFGDCGNCKPGFLCLCLEVVFCCWCSIVGNRWIIQSTYMIKNTAFENFLFWFACIFSWVWCIFRIFCSVPWEVDCIIDMCYCALSACMQSQQWHEIDVQKGKTDRFRKPKHKQMHV
eukprot:TRINITY_DN9098_c0_g1_i1.p1 TRINITY_DN9098_c0_g1~~TRINITY_DN9098_c0_g1_i1.p1  ORF type:complete len:181 (+),score=17.53 TRINITY_DN9098_c0_g1_i1:140-682(+)